MHLKIEDIIKYVASVVAGLLAWAAAGAISAFLTSVSGDFREMKNSVVQLNQNFAVMMTAQSTMSDEQKELRAAQKELAQRVQKLEAERRHR